MYWPQLVVDGPGAIYEYQTWSRISWLRVFFHNFPQSMRREETQLDATEWFIALMFPSSLLPHMVCNALVAGGWRSGAGQQGSCSSSCPHPGRIACCPAPDRRPPATKALHTICDNNTSIVSSFWWWTYKCPKHVEQVISEINHSVASSWFSSLRIYNDARTNMHQIFQSVYVATCLLL